MNQRLGGIDGLRAIAMIAVIAVHCGLFQFGWMGVWLFYVISGFVITRNFLAEREGGLSRLPHYVSFLVRRFFRIVPPYLVYVLICCQLIFLIGDHSQFRDLPYLLTFTHNWWMLFHQRYFASAWFGFLHLWTISVEEQFYLVFPLLFFFVPARKLSVVLAILIVSGPAIRWLLEQVLVYCGTTIPGDASNGLYFSSLGQFDAFLMGALMAHFEIEIRNKPSLSRRLSIFALDAVVIYCAVYSLLGSYLHLAASTLFAGNASGQAREFFMYSAIDLCAAALVASSIRGNLWFPRWLSWIGLNSYSGYLYHGLFLPMFCRVVLHRDPWSLVLGPGVSVLIRLEIFVLTLLASVTAAFISRLVLEKHSIAVGHRLAAAWALRLRPLESTATVASAV